VTSPTLIEKSLVIRDEMHGDLSFSPLLRRVIDHRCFQRLRYIKQMGLAEYVFPCANHTRFQHSLGASYLAAQYFDSMVKSWLQTPFLFEGKQGRTTFHAERTLQTIREVTSHAPSREFWRTVVSLAGLLHDVGHGPWSHTFENLNLQQNFVEATSGLTGPVADYFRDLQRAGRRFQHEDLSVLYTYEILRDLQNEGLANAEAYALATISLINHRVAEEGRGEKYVRELTKALETAEIRGGVEMHRLLSPIVSGPFDVDRMDYIQRDGRNSGVHIAGIEWRRIVSKLLPCLAEHASDKGEPGDVVLVTNIKNQHIIDDFMFTLFQMYAQVYMHPKIVGLEESVRIILDRRVPKDTDFVVDFETHKSLSDEGFRNLISRRFGVQDIEKLLHRAVGAKLDVARYPSDPELETELRQEGYERIRDVDRPMLKDPAGVFLYSTLGKAKGYYVKPWSSVSPIAQQLASVYYSPNIWMRSPFYYGDA